MVAEWFGLNGHRQLLEEAAWRSCRYVEDVQWRAVSPTRAGLAGLVPDPPVGRPVPG
jgi:hypothetical protein